MQKEELAALINGRESGREITKDEELLAKAHGLIVFFGASDDLLEMRGAIHDEVGAYDGGEARFSKELSLFPEDTDEHEDFLKEHGLYDAFAAKYGNKVESEWDPAHGNPDALVCSWLLKSEIPHATFDIMEDGELYCRGLVIDTKDLK